MDGASSDWYADESFWAETFAFMFPDSSFDAAIEQIPQIMELTGCREGAMLDLGCGPGRYAILDKARAYAATEGVEVEFVTEDMHDFVRPGAFDLAISMLTSFGYFDDDDENLGVARNIFESLKPGGVFVFDTYGKEIIAKIFLETNSKELPGGELIVQRRSVINDWSQMENHWLLIKDGQTRSFRLRHWIYSGREFKQLLMSAGFAEVELYGDLEGSPYGPDAARLIALGRKA